jgi:hypothetical protein
MPIPNLSRYGRSIRNHQDVYWFDDFTGYNYDNSPWTITGSWAKNDVGDEPGVIQVATLTGGFGSIHSTLGAFSVAAHLDIEWRVLLNVTTSPLRVEFGAANAAPSGAHQAVAFIFDTTLSATYWYKAANDGTWQNDITTVAVGNTWHTYRIICEGANSVRFLIDDVEAGAAVTAHIPSVNLMPYAYVVCASATKSWRAGYVEVYGDRGA